MKISDGKVTVYFLSRQFQEGRHNTFLSAAPRRRDDSATTDVDDAVVAIVRWPCVRLRQFAICGASGEFRKFHDDAPCFALLCIGHEEKGCFRTIIRRLQIVTMLPLSRRDHHR